jgi:hypothetical protein
MSILFYLPRVSPPSIIFYLHDAPVMVKTEKPSLDLRNKICEKGFSCLNIGCHF